MYLPQRITCLTAETTEVLYLLGEQQRIVGISGFCKRPAIARQEKPVISAFSTANISKIIALQPDLVLTCTDIQADIAATLIKAGIEVHAFNQRSIAGIFAMIATLGRLTGAGARARQLITELQTRIAQARQVSNAYQRKPLVYFEEWNKPLISGIRWVAELIAIAGGRDCFADLSDKNSAAERVVQPDEVVKRNPDIIIASWCGKRFQPEQVVQRPCWQQINAVRNGFIHAMDSDDILQPGPSVINVGLQQLQAIIQRWHQSPAGGT